MSQRLMNLTRFSVQLHLSVKLSKCHAHLIEFDAQTIEAILNQQVTFHGVS